MCNYTRTSYEKVITWEIYSCFIQFYQVKTTRTELLEPENEETDLAAQPPISGYQISEI